MVLRVTVQGAGCEWFLYLGGDGGFCFFVSFSFWGAERRGGRVEIWEGVG